MSNALFHDTVTLFTPTSDGGYEKHVIKYTKVMSSERESGSDITVYIPLFGRRSLKYLSPSERTEAKGSTFTLMPGQFIAVGSVKESTPQANVLTITEVTPKNTGSRRIRHVKVKASNTTPTEEEVYE